MMAVAARRTFSLVLALGLCLAVASCRGDDELSAPTDAPSPASLAPSPTSRVGPATLDVSLREFAIDVGPNTIPAGSAVFDVSNVGDVAHEFVVIRSELPPDGLPLTDTGFEVDLESLDVVVRYEAGDDLLIRRAETVALTADLDSGSYVLICNVPGHYESGMAATLTVD